MEIDDSIEIRLLKSEDSIAILTDLLHRAYKPLADAGLRYFATHQTEEQTRERIQGGRCFVAVLGGEIVGTVLYRYPAAYKDSDKSTWYSRLDVAYFGQFAVEPDLQGRGIGGRILDLVEKQALEDGAAELAFDTSQQATSLIEYYSKRGFRFIEEVDHRPFVNYKSFVMSKTLLPGSADGLGE